MEFLVVFSVILISASAHPIQSEHEENTWAKKLPLFEKEHVPNLLINLPENILLSNELDLEELCKVAVSEPDKQVECLKLEKEKAAEKDVLFLKKSTPSHEFAGDAYKSNKRTNIKKLSLKQLRPRKLYKRSNRNESSGVYKKCFFNAITCF